MPMKRKAQKTLSKTRIFLVKALYICSFALNIFNISHNTFQFAVFLRSPSTEILINATTARRKAP